RNRALYVTPPIKDGQLVLVRARVTLYEARGDYQLAIESIDAAGHGALQLAFDRLKVQLEAEGLFSTQRKKPLPSFIKRLAILTSPNGAAIHDVLSVLSRRFPLLPIEIWPVPVQGQEAAPELMKSLQAAIQCERYDAILITRGGGSLEDLWPFNHEQFVRLAANSALPILSAIGHEVDFTLLDFVADIRAPTPSAAAELLSPSNLELTQRLQHLKQRLQRSIDSKRHQLAQKSDQAFMRIQALNPSYRLRLGQHSLHALNLRLRQVMQTRLHLQLARLKQCAYQLDRHHPRASISIYRSQLHYLQQHLHSQFNQQLGLRLMRLKQAGSSLNALSPLATLNRGFSILRDANQHIIHSVQDINIHEPITAQVSDGFISLQVAKKP
ncbi:MAG: exodeoxyribonuclease VII large subunit, partial [Arenimonas sp.]|nr:exodeoxyribonuclease VII large subunit [Arenimonas sp.]